MPNSYRQEREEIPQILLTYANSNTCKAARMLSAGYGAFRGASGKPLCQSFYTFFNYFSAKTYKIKIRT
jgi:hypothetical protein